MGRKSSVTKGKVQCIRISEPTKSSSVYRAEKGSGGNIERDGNEGIAGRREDSNDLAFRQQQTDWSQRQCVYIE